MLRGTLPSGRFIPTCVGNTPHRKWGCLRSAVHPHVRGEYEDRRAGRILGCRFIPTCVGNTDPAVQRHSRWTVHPHVRGEYVHKGRQAALDVGSSPRAWGILPARKLLRLIHRFIPTCVGNTGLPAAIPAALPVHPHVRGEYGHPGGHPGGPAGSSPRAWGIPGRVFLSIGIPRFIPTCVGNTTTVLS